MSEFNEDRVRVKLEQTSLDWRSNMERAYQADPARTHSELVYMGYWDIAAQLKIDHAARRLRPPVAELGQ
jgi:hypothetical protein